MDILVYRFICYCLFNLDNRDLIRQSLIRNRLGPSVGVATGVISFVESLYVRAGYDVVFIEVIFCGYG